MGEEREATKATAEATHLWCLPQLTSEVAERVGLLAKKLGVAEAILRAGLAWLHVSESVDRLEACARRLRELVTAIESVVDELAQVVAAGRREGGPLGV